MTRLGIRLLGGAAVVAVTMVGTSLPALAHVSVNPETATQGGFSKLTFRVPNETEDASTTKVQVVLPASQPLGFVSIKPHAGWSFAVTKGKLAKPITTDDGPVTEYVSSITWTATSAASSIKPGTFDEFDISAGPLPEAKSMEFKALQTYDNGDVVRWIESASGTEEPEHPAPTLKLTPASATEGAAAPADTNDAAAPAAEDDSASQSSVNLAIGLSVAALIVGLLGGAAGVTALRRKSPSPVPAQRPMTKV
jgi:uncharacterized protein YcnI